jgi:thioredoxin-related protein
MSEFMKRARLLSMLVLATLGQANAQTIFRKFSSVEILLQTAKSEQKAILIDGFTDWCYWCKVLDKKVFADSAIASMINNHFIPVKFNMESDSLGILFARKYSVNGYPNVIVLSQHGNLIAQLFGYSEPEKYKLLLEQTLQRVQYDSIIKGFSANFNLSYSALYNKAYAYPLSAREYADSISYNEYLNQQSNWIDETNFVVLKRFIFKIDNHNLGRLIDLQEPISQMYGNVEFNDLMYNTFGARIQYALSVGDKPALDSLITLLENIIADDLKPFRLHYELQYFKQVKDYKSMVAAIDSFYAKYPAGSSDAYKINDLAWYLYENCEDLTFIKSAAGWMEKFVLPIQTNYMYVDTYAALLFKLKQYKSAQLQAKRAIELGKNENLEIKETENLLLKIEAAMKKK